MLSLSSARFFAAKVASHASHATSATPEIPIIGMKISPYAMFVKENFKTDSSAKNTDLMKELSQKWKGLSIDEKNKYTDLSKKHNEKKLDDFFKLSAEEQKKLVVMAKEKKEDRSSRRHAKERREKKKLDGRPTVPPNAYALFIKEKLVGAGSNVKDKMKEAVGQWKSMAESQKKKYTDEAKKLNDEYHTNLKKWEAEMKEKKSSPE